MDKERWAQDFVEGGYYVKSPTFNVTVYGAESSIPVNVSLYGSQAQPLDARMAGSYDNIIEVIPNAIRKTSYDRSLYAKLDNLDSISGWLDAANEQTRLAAAQEYVKNYESLTLDMDRFLEQKKSDGLIPLVGDWAGWWADFKKWDNVWEPKIDTYERAMQIIQEELTPMDQRYCRNEGR